MADPKFIKGLEEVRWPIHIPWTQKQRYLCQKHSNEVWEKQDRIMRNGCQRCGYKMEVNSGRPWTKYKEEKYLWLCDTCIYLVGELKDVFGDQFRPEDF